MATETTKEKTSERYPRRYVEAALQALKYWHGPKAETVLYGKNGQRLKRPYVKYGEQPKYPDLCITIGQMEEILIWYVEKKLNEDE